eukprot:13970681-Alexandrium_andersonii.AAC.2
MELLAAFRNPTSEQAVVVYWCSSLQAQTAFCTPTSQDIMRPDIGLGNGVALELQTRQRNPAAALRKPHPAVLELGCQETPNELNLVPEWCAIRMLGTRSACSSPLRFSA